MFLPESVYKEHAGSERVAAARIEATPFRVHFEIMPDQK